MSVIYKCDGCGKTGPGVFWGGRDVRWTLPQGWWPWVADGFTLYDYCSLQCLETLKALEVKRTGYDRSYIQHGSNKTPITDKP